jgi:hypothetical protein
VHQKVAHAAEQTQNLSEICRNLNEIYRNLSVIFENLTEILSFVCGSSVFESLGGENPAGTGRK